MENLPDTPKGVKLTGEPRKRAPGGGRKPRPDAQHRKGVYRAMDSRVLKALEILNPKSFGDAVTELLEHYLAERFEPDTVTPDPEGWVFGGKIYADHLDALVAALEASSHE